MDSNPRGSHRVNTLLSQDFAFPPQQGYMMEGVSPLPSNPSSPRQNSGRKLKLYVGDIKRLLTWWKSCHWQN